MKELKICHLYPDVLNLYSDGGNVICMKKRLEWRGIKAEVTNIGIGDKLNADDYDLFFIGGGQDPEEGALLDDIRNKKEEIKKAVEDEKVFLAICGGYQLLGNYYKTKDGKKLDLIGAVDFYTVCQNDRLIGNYCYSLDEIPSLKVVAFENHAGKTYLGENVKPLGHVLKGFGNNGEDMTEGVRYKNVFGSYGHGSLLPKNPVLADYILSLALERKYGQKVELAPLNDEYELKAHKSILSRLGCE